MGNIHLASGIKDKLWQIQYQSSANQWRLTLAFSILHPIGHLHHLYVMQSYIPSRSNLHGITLEWPSCLFTTHCKEQLLHLNTVRLLYKVGRCCAIGKQLYNRNCSIIVNFSQAIWLDVRFNRSMLVKFCQDRKVASDYDLDSCTFGYNYSQHDSTKFSLFELTFGWNAA